MPPRLHGCDADYLPGPKGRQDIRKGDGPDVVLGKQMEGLGSDVRTIWTAITTIMSNKSIDGCREDEMNLLVMLIRAIPQANNILHYMMTK